MQLWIQEDRMGYERLEKSLTDTIKEEQAKLGFRKEAIRLYYPLSSLNHFFDVQEGEEQMLHRLQHLPETWQEKLGDVGVTAKKSVSVFIFRNREVCMSMSMKSRMNLSGNWWNWLAGMAVPCRRSGNCSVNIRPMWNVRRSKMGNSTGCSGLRRMRKIPIIIVLRMRESISFTIVFCRRITGSLESDENRHR